MPEGCEWLQPGRHNRCIAVENEGRKHRRMLPAWLATKVARLTLEVRLCSKWRSRTSTARAKYEASKDAGTSNAPAHSGVPGWPSLLSKATQDARSYHFAVLFTSGYFENHSRRAHET